MSIMIRRLTARVADRTLLGIGAALLAGGYLCAIGLSFGCIIVGGFLVGCGQAGLYTTLQRWASDAAPHARGRGTALFATGAFVGAGLAALVGAIAPDAYREVFAAAAACALLAGTIACRRTEQRAPEGLAESLVDQKIKAA